MTSRGAAGLLLLVVGLLVAWLLVVDPAAPTAVPNRWVGLDTPVERRVHRDTTESASAARVPEERASSDASGCRVVVTGAPPGLVRVALQVDGDFVPVESDASGDYVVPRTPGRLSVRAEGRVTEFVQLTGIEERVEVALRPGRACWIRIQDARHEPLWDQESVPSSIDTTRAVPDVVYLGGAVSLSGTVIGADGSPVHKGRVALRWGEKFRAAGTGVDGGFRLRIPDDVGEGELTVRHEQTRLVRTVTLPASPLRIELE